MENWYSDEDGGVIQGLVQERQARSKEIGTTLSHLRRLKKNDVLRSPRYYPVRFLTEAAEAYVWLFNNASVFYSSLAVEVALVIKLGQVGRLPEDRRGLGFSRIIKLASRTPKPVLDQSLATVAENVRKLRNCYIHYYNIMASQVVIQKEYGRRLEELEKGWPSDRDRLSREMPAPELAELETLLRQLEPYFRSEAQDDTHSLRAIPYHDDLVSDESQEFIQAQITSLMKCMQTPGGATWLGRHVPDIEHYDAWCGMEWATELIEGLRFLD